MLRREKQEAERGRGFGASASLPTPRWRLRCLWQRGEKSTRYKVTRLLAFREQEVEETPQEDDDQAPPHALRGIMARGMALGPFSHSFLSSPLLILGTIHSHGCSFLFTRDRSHPLAPSHLIPSIIPSLSSQSTSLSAFNTYSSTSFFLQSPSSSFSSQRDVF